MLPIVLLAAGQPICVARARVIAETGVLIASAARVACHWRRPSGSVAGPPLAQLLSRLGPNGRRGEGGACLRLSDRPPALPWVARRNAQQHAGHEGGAAGGMHRGECIGSRRWTSWNGRNRSQTAAVGSIAANGCRFLFTHNRIAVDLGRVRGRVTDERSIRWMGPPPARKCASNGPLSLGATRLTMHACTARRPCVGREWVGRPGRRAET